jgi:multiple RNA-binding domain-containing protein 1
MSRICVKNIGKSTSEKQLRELFSSKGEVTDVKVIASKDGHARRLAFVGFRTELQATEAQKHFNNTFIGMSKMNIEMAKKFNDKGLKEAKEKFAAKKGKKGAKPADSDDEDEKEETVKPSKPKGDSLLQVDTNSVAGRKKAEFLEMMKSRRNTNKWANDDVAGTGTALDAAQVGAGEDRIHANSDSGDDSDSDSDSDSVDNFAAEAPGSSGAGKQEPSKPLSDLEYLRSKIARKRSASDSSSSGASSAGSDSDDDSDMGSGSEGEGEQGRPAGKANKQATRPSGEEKSAAADKVKGNSAAKEASAAPTAGAGAREEEEEEPEDARLFVKNLPFSCTEEEFTSLFAAFGPISEIHLPLDEEKRGKGYGFVQFMLPEHADSALASLAGEAFQGRVLFVVKALRQKEKESSALAGRDNKAKLSSFQLKKEEERRKAMNRKEGWNAAFVRSDAVVDSLAAR